MSVVKVYFEGKGTSEWVASFADEETYIKCLPILEKKIKNEGWEFVTESMDQTGYDMRRLHECS